MTPRRLDIPSQTLNSSYKQLRCSWKENLLDALIPPPFLSMLRLKEWLIEEFPTSVEDLAEADVQTEIEDLS
jgi:hypothetical protein